MKEIKHKKGWWSFYLNWIEFKCFEDEFIRIFQGWEYNATKSEGMVKLIFFMN